MDAKLVVTLMINPLLTCEHKGWQKDNPTMSKFLWMISVIQLNPFAVLPIVRSWSMPLWRVLFLNLVLLFLLLLIFLYFFTQTTKNTQKHSKTPENQQKHYKNFNKQKR
jgi:uncharacterized membrane protein YraQ (UPF0718 family)